MPLYIRNFSATVHQSSVALLKKEKTKDTITH